jgi:hypothetical protein
MFEFMEVTQGKHDTEEGFVGRRSSQAFPIAWRPAIRTLPIKNV